MAVGVAVLALVSGVLLALQLASLWWVALGLALMFTGINALEAILPATVTRLAPGRLRGTALGLFASCQFLGIFCGGAVGGAVLAAGGRDALAVLAAGCALVWLLALGLRRLVPATATV